MRVLRGITWDHPRGYAPLMQSADDFRALRPDIRIEWSRRSLRDFGVQPIEVLAERYDIVVIDHPFAGRAQTLGCLRDLRTLFDPGFLRMLAGESVGASQRSYDFGGLWGLPTDAAAQVASFRPDLLAGLGWQAPPASFAEVLALGQAALKAGKYLGLPSCQSDAACLVASIAANLGSPIVAESDVLLDKDVFDTVLGHIETLIAFCHPQSPRWNPIDTYDAMSKSDEIVYVPLAFGYVTYAHRKLTRPIRFTSIAGPGPDPRAGAILGGAGCAISAACTDRGAAVDYLTWLHQPDYQMTGYFRSGGQPGLRSAWQDPRVDFEAGGFFSATLETLDKSWLRPRFDGFIEAFEHMGLLVNRWLLGEVDRRQVVGSSNEAYARTRAQSARNRE